MGENEVNSCGNCKHWHERKKEYEWRLRRGDCDKIPQGCSWYCDEYQQHFAYDGWSFEDEYYGDVFGCFEPNNLREE